MLDFVCRWWTRNQNELKVQKCKCAKRGTLRYVPVALADIMMSDSLLFYQSNAFRNRSRGRTGRNGECFLGIHTVTCGYVISRVDVELAQCFSDKH